MDFKDSIQNWLNSPYYQKFYKQIEDSKDLLMSFKFNMDMVHESKTKTNTMISKDELESLIEDILIYSHITDEEKFDFEIASGEINKFMNKSFKVLLFEYVRAIVNWNYYLKFYLEHEDYYFCAKLRDVIKVEETEFIRMINLYYPIRLRLVEEYEDQIKMIDTEAKNAFQIPQ